MKLYAIRGRETGWLLDYQEEDGQWGLGRDIIQEVFWDSGPLDSVIAVASNQLKNDILEPITLRIEPTEPCEWCGVNDGAWCETYHGRMVAIDNEGYPETLLAENWTFCPNCGRSLKDGE